VDTLTTALQSVWYNLRAEHQLLWAYHWRSKGPSYYGDHLLFQRLYEARLPEIDKLAEVMVGVAGPETVNPDEAAKAAKALIERVESVNASDPQRAATLVADTLAKIEKANDLLEQSPYSVAINNVIAAIADSHLEALYLLKRRLA
jgi:hypothetical protein